MQRSNFIIKLTSVIVLLAIIFYIGYVVYDSQVNPLKTVSATVGALSDSAETSGYIVRTEAPVGDSGADTVVVAQENKRVSVGQVLGVRYLTGDSVSRASEMRETELKISQIETMLMDDDSEESMDAAAASSVEMLSYAVKSSDLSSIDEICSNVDAYVFRSRTQYTDEELRDELDTMEAKLDRLASDSSTDTVSMTAAMPGVFSSVMDGFENVGPEDIKNLTPTSLVAIFTDSNKLSKNSLGKLITGIKWYYAAIMDTEDAKILSDSAELAFFGEYNGTLRMNVESVGMDAGGRCVVVFSSGMAISDIAGVRTVSATVEFETVTGILVPKEAMHVDENGQKYVYVLSGLQAQRVDVTITGEIDDCYITGSKSGGLLNESAEIIVKANGLYDGKVVR